MPPPSVWLLFVVLIGPAVGVFGLAALEADRDLAWVGFVLLVPTATPAVGALVGRPAGIRLVDAAVCFFGLVFGLLLLVALATDDLNTTCRALVPVGWLAAIGCLRRWPETRRWCGLLPPELEDDW